MSNAARTSIATPTRRDLVLGSVAAVGVLAAGPARPAFAQAAPHRFNVGSAEVIVLSDGTMAAPLDFILPGRQRPEVAETFKAAGKTLADITLQVNVAVVKLGNELILVDAGGGPDFAPARGKLTDNMEKAGIKPEAITRVVFTHAHPDHLWGVIDPLDGSTLYTKARHYIPAIERDYWLKPGVETTVPESARGSAAGTQRRLKELGDKLEAVKVGAEIMPGLTTIDSAGHTPGHVSILLRSGTEQLLIGGDALTEPVISFARPEWPWGPDWDKDRAIASRKRVLDMLIADKTPILGYHLPWPGVGRVERANTGYRLVQS